MSKKNKNVSAVKHESPGRPKYQPVFPRSKEWTFTDWMEANGIETNPGSKNFGKGPNCTMLTLRKHLERDMYFHKEGKPLIAKFRTKANPKSNIVILKDVTSEPNSDSGLGRRAYLYSLRANASVKRATKTTKTTATSGDVSDATKQYEETKAILTAPTVIVPAVTITPEVAPAPAPVAETQVEATPVPTAEAPAAS